MQGKRLEGLRKASGMSRKEFSEYFGIPYRTLQDWEIGQRDPIGYLVDLIQYKLEREGLLSEGANETC